MATTFLAELITIAILLFAGILSAAVMVNSPNYKSYRKIYKKLSTMTFCKNGNRVYFVPQFGSKALFIWFIDENEFKIDAFTYLHSAIFTYFDPYSFYWLLKYRRWFNKNINVETLPNY